MSTRRLSLDAQREIPVDHRICQTSDQSLDRSNDRTLDPPNVLPHVQHLEPPLVQLNDSFVQDTTNLSVCGSDSVDLYVSCSPSDHMRAAGSLGTGVDSEEYGTNVNNESLNDCDDVPVPVDMISFSHLALNVTVRRR